MHLSFSTKVFKYPTGFRRWMNINEPCLDSDGKPFGPPLLSIVELQTLTQKCKCDNLVFPSRVLMEPLHQAPAVIQQLISSLSTISSSTYDVLCEIMMP
jgi:hypothetical protein